MAPGKIDEMKSRQTVGDVISSKNATGGWKKTKDVDIYLPF
jgi:hypothetical protein